MRHLSDRYNELLIGRPSLSEDSLFDLPRMMPEAELQARWFSGEFGRTFTSLDGQTVEIVQFGVWNHEPGPDFIGAAVRIDGGQAVRGAIELDPVAEDWEQHGHSTNPAFDDVALHVFPGMGGKQFFTRTTSHRFVPQVQLDLSRMELRPSYELLAAHPGRCSAPLAGLSEASARSLVEAAALFRLRKKAARLAAVIAAQGPDEAVYQGIAAALGYKANKLPFLLLAQRLPLAGLKGLNGPEIQALFFGIAGFINTPEPAIPDDESRQWLGAMWQFWWKERSARERLVLQRKAWHLGGMRPVNHPQRRIAALSLVATRWKTFRKCLDSGEARTIGLFFEDLEDAFWSRRFTLESKQSKRRMALIGETRAAEILANVIFPLMHHRGVPFEEAYRAMRSGLTNFVVETAAIRLFGETGTHRHLEDRLINQQGLIQIYEDFCLHDRSDCANCPFPERVAHWKSD